MQVYYDPDEVGKIKNPVVTTGIFDGVHIGHKAILNRLKKNAGEIDGETVVITFYPHPRTILYPDSKGRNLKMICSKTEKIKLLEEIGIDHLIIIPFTREFSTMTPRQFIDEILINKLHAKTVVVGFNHHFGYLKTGNYEVLREMGVKKGFNVEEIPSQELENETISSTRIRNALIKGYIQRANAYLDHYYYIIGKLQKGDPKYNQIGFPVFRVVLEEDSKLIPPEGVYAISVGFENRMLHGMVLIAKKTAKGKKQEIHVHFFNSDGMNLNHRELLINIHKRIRKKFTGSLLEKLKVQLLNAKTKIEELIY